MGKSGRTPSYFLVKSEESVYSIADLERDTTTRWEGVRNYQARNLMKDEMREGDLVLFYHSSSDPSGVAGLARVAGVALPDPSQFDRKSPYYDAASTQSEPRWWLVELVFVERLPQVLPLAALKADRALEAMLVTRKGQRLSVQPVAKEHFCRVLELAKAKTRV